MKIEIPACVGTQTFLDRLKNKKWGFVLVTGENRAGKSAYIKFIEDHANENGYAVAHIEINPEEIRTQKPMEPMGYFNLQVFRGLRLGPGNVLSYSLDNDERFRKRLRAVLERKFRDLEFWSAPLAGVLLTATDDADLELQNP